MYKIILLGLSALFWTIGLAVTPLPPRQSGKNNIDCLGPIAFSTTGSGIVHSTGSTEENTRMVLQKKSNNNKQWSPILATEPGGGSATILLEIEVGDQVAIYLNGNQKKFKTINEQGIEVTSFSGHRIAKT
ncbi:uncharacterized protein LOC112686999 isoform X2 [Sipha flava]|uniref:Uncharacterized protein LOC112686999 isoform X2 n=1 Tax=Sipha flava TaxID=143950 RepID=A0A8B8FWD5_9HEMI|nr:uncharacterized protein LOC112686999 isoform X2 [Sipha flava]